MFQLDRLTAHFKGQVVCVIRWSVVGSLNYTKDRPIHELEEGGGGVGAEGGCLIPRNFSCHSVLLTLCTVYSSSGHT